MYILILCILKCIHTGGNFRISYFFVRVNVLLLFATIRSVVKSVKVLVDEVEAARARARARVMGQGCRARLIRLKKIGRLYAGPGWVM